MDDKSKALEAIHEEAVKLLKFDMPFEVRQGIGLIISIARYQLDVRGSDQKKSGNPE